MQLPQARWASPLTLSAKRAKNIRTLAFESIACRQTSEVVSRVT